MTQDADLPEHFEFDGLKYYAEGRLLVRGRERSVLREKVAALLEIFLGSHGRLLRKNDLIGALWPPGSSAGPEDLRTLIKELRAVLGKKELIRAVRGQGYIIAEPVRPPGSTVAEQQSIISSAGGVPFGTEITAEVAHRFANILQDPLRQLYRRNYMVHAKLRSVQKGLVQIQAEMSAELLNATTDRQPFRQELTIDDGEDGHVNTMSVHVEGGPGSYTLNNKKPPITEQRKGHVAYLGPEMMIEPITAGIKYFCSASWIFHRRENGIWYNAMSVDTLGFSVELDGEPEFDTSPTISSSNLLLVGERIECHWNKRAKQSRQKYSR